MDLSIIIVTWNSEKDIAKCLDSLICCAMGIQHEIIVIDNASHDQTQKILDSYQAKYPEIHIIVNKENLGFATANNQGIRITRGKYVLLLNPDTEVRDKALEILVGFMESHPVVGIAGPKLLNTDGTLQYSVRRFPLLADQAMIVCKLHRMMPRARILHAYKLSGDLHPRSCEEVDQVMGAAFLVRRQVFDDIGMLDTRFSRNFEEVDFCFRSHRARWGVWYVPEAEVTHRQGASFSQVNLLAKQWRWCHDVIYYFVKRKAWGPVIALILLSPIACLLAGSMALVAKVGMPVIARHKISLI